MIPADVVGTLRNAGENIAWNTGGELGPQKVVDMWMSEARK